MEKDLQTTEPGSWRRARGIATRADIVSVAKRLFSQHGYRNTALKDIQTATGMSKGAFYHHFKSKEELALAVLGSAQCDYTEHLTGPSMAQDSPGARLEFLLDRVLQLNSRPEWLTCQMVATLCAELTTADGRLREAVQSLQSRRLDALADLIREAQETGEVDRQADPLVWAHWISCTFTGLVLSRKIGTVSADPAQVVAQIKSFLFSPSTPTTGASLRPATTSPRKGIRDYDRD
jgi:TetR/AcrR family transcriptional repressor of nem operon